MAKVKDTRQLLAGPSATINAAAASRFVKAALSAPAENTDEAADTAGEEKAKKHKKKKKSHHHDA